MAQSSAIQRHELEEVMARLEWIDGERRKSLRQVAQLEQRLNDQERVIGDRQRRVKELETKLAEVTLLANRAGSIDTTLQQFKDEMVTLIDQYDERVSRATGEMERLRRVEQEVTAREISEVRKDLPEIGRLRNDMELRQAEESRLANLIGKLQTRINPIEGRIDSWERELTLVTAAEKRWAKSINEVEVSLQGIERRFDPITTRLDVVNNTVLKVEPSMQELRQQQHEQRQQLKRWVDQVQLGEYERNQRVQSWQTDIDTFKQELSKFSREWIGYSDQYKEAQMAVQTLAEWQRQLEQQQQESSELTRIETTRMQTRWDSYLTEMDKRWRNFEVDQDQRLTDASRRDRSMEEMIYELQEVTKQLQSEKDSLWRVQTAQLDAIRQIPRVWLEEVEKARSRDPNRRREPSLVTPIDEELY